ncbi:MAG: response regulator [Candidatus Acidiferrum sp.]
MKQGILVVEDNHLNRELLCDWLEMEGYEVWAAADLKTSYEVFAKQPPHAVLLDINLGKEDGLDLVVWMREKPEVSKIPVIAVTAHALAIEQQRIRELGCIACLTKPINFQGLRKELDHCLRNPEASQSDD